MSQLNYFEKLNSLKEALKDTDQSEVFFNSNLTQDQINSFYSLGYWDHILIGYIEISRVFVAIRIVPQLPCEEWPIIYIERHINSVMMSSNFKSFPILLLQDLIESKEMFEAYKDDQQEVEYFYKNIYNIITGSDKVYDILIDYLNDKSNIPTDSDDLDVLSKERREKYITCYKKLDNSKEFNVFAEFVRKMRQDENFLPKLSITDYGVWTTRIYKLIAIRAYFSSTKTTVGNRVLSLWQSFIEPHTYDPQTADPDYYPENSTDTDNYYTKIIDKINYYREDFPEEIKKHPLFKVALNMRNAEVSNSLGFATAAAVIDEQYNDPILVWKTLINASYYTSSKEQHILLAKQAKALCERNGWDDAAYAVTNNIKTYESV